MLKSSGERRLVPGLSEKVSSFLPYSKVLSVGFLQIFFIKLRKFASVFSLLKDFIMNVCWILLNYFFCIYRYIHVFFLFQSVDEMDFITYFLNTWINPTWSLYINLFIHCWIHFANILFRTFASIFFSDISL